MLACVVKLAFYCFLKRINGNLMKGSNIQPTMHGQMHDLVIDFENGKVIDRGNFRIRKTL